MAEPAWARWTVTAWPAWALAGRPGEPGSGFENRAQAYVGHLDDPGSWRQVDPPIDPRTGKPTDIWCGGTSLLADGRVLVTGDNLDEDDGRARKISRRRSSGMAESTSGPVMASP